MVKITICLSRRLIRLHQSKVTWLHGWFVDRPLTAEDRYISVTSITMATCSWLHLLQRLFRPTSMLHQRHVDALVCWCLVPHEKLDGGSNLRRIKSAIITSAMEVGLTFSPASIGPSVCLSAGLREKFFSSHFHETYCDYGSWLYE